MKTSGVFLLSAAALAAAAFAPAPSASAQGYAPGYAGDNSAYRAYCADPAYRARYAYYCDYYFPAYPAYGGDDYGYQDYYGSSYGYPYVYAFPYAYPYYNRGYYSGYYGRGYYGRGGYWGRGV